VPPAIELNVLHVDEHLIVLDKPAGLLSAPGRGADKQDCLIARARAQWPDALLVHRLDQATSGLLLVARGAEMHKALSKAFETRQVEKRYEAIVQGLVAQDEGLIDLPLMADWPNRPRQMVHPDGKPSVTRFKALARYENTTRLALFPETGRSHQLRVHLKALGHPILGDALYGDAATAPRLMLHACELAVAYPATHRPSRWISPAPF
jgi:tRNA pseudouridine32 synthase/23S rRNA pseudouridine746 synthase